VGGRLEIVRLLLEAGADLGAFGKSGATPLNIATLNEQVEVLKVLLPLSANYAFHFSP